MEKNVNFSQMANADIRIKLLNYENEYNAKKTQIIKLINELQALDKLYIDANNELKKRGTLNDE